MRRLPVGVAVTVVLLLSACGEAPSALEEIGIERQKFEVLLISWTPMEGGQLALDLQVEVQGESRLNQLTVEVRQVGADEQVLRSDPTSLDVAGLGFDGRALLTVRVPSGGDGVTGVAVLVEPLPPASERAAYPEFSGID